MVGAGESIHLGVEEILDAPGDRVVAGTPVAAHGRRSGVETRVHGW